MTIRRDPALPLPVATHSARFGLMSELVLVETNHAPLLDAATASFGRFEVPHHAGQPIRISIFRDAGADDAAAAEPARLTHRIHGDTYVFTGSADLRALPAAPPDAAAVNGRAGSGVAFVGTATAADERLVRYSFLEGMALALLTYGRGYFSLHASGVALGEVGVALLGPEGAGKSTLAVAAARRGLDVFAEDAVFVRAGPSGLEFWGLPWTQRLVIDARRFFPELDHVEPTRQPNRELKIELDLDHYYPGRARPFARPAALVVLEPGSSGSTGLAEIGSGAAEVSAQWPWGDHWTDEHERAASLMAGLPVYRLPLTGTPDEAIDQLEPLLHDLGRRPGGA